MGLTVCFDHKSSRNISNRNLAQTSWSGGGDRSSRPAQLQAREKEQKALSLCELLHHLSGTLDVGEQRRDRLALAYDCGRFGLLCRNRAQSRQPGLTTFGVHGRRCAWQNAHVERVIGSIRRECLDHVVIFSERHLRRVLSYYVEYYHRTRTHLALNKDCPDPRPIQPHTIGRVVAIRQVGGLHHRYERLAA
jgi:Integrase core domain